MIILLIFIISVIIIVIIMILTHSLYLRYLFQSFRKAKAFFFSCKFINILHKNFYYPFTTQSTSFHCRQTVNGWMELIGFEFHELWMEWIKWTKAGDGCEWKLTRSIATRITTLNPFMGATDSATKSVALNSQMKSSCLKKSSLSVLCNVIHQNHLKTIVLICFSWCWRWSMRQCLHLWKLESSFSLWGLIVCCLIPSTSSVLIQKTILSRIFYSCVNQS